MGVCLGWTLQTTIAPAAWAAITDDLTKALEAYPARMAAQRQAMRSKGLSGLLLDGLGYRRHDPGFERGLQGAGMDAESIVIMPSKGGRATGRQEAFTWTVQREAGEGWCKTGAEPHTYLLFAAFALIETHAPGVLALTQDDIELEDDERADLQAWLSTVVGHPVARPPRLPPESLEADEEEEDLTLPLPATTLPATSQPLTETTPVVRRPKR